MCLTAQPLAAIGRFIAHLTTSCGTPGHVRFSVRGVNTDRGATSRVVNTG